LALHRMTSLQSLMTFSLAVSLVEKKSRILSAIVSNSFVAFFLKLSHQLMRGLFYI
jgi:hypothetical protein